MNKLTAIRIKNNDNTYSDQIPVSALAENVQWDSTHSLIDIIGEVDVDTVGNIQEQIDNILNKLSTDTSLSISGKFADAKATGDAINNLKGAVGSPLVAATAAAMIDTKKVYVYTGSETGYISGNWYYHNGTSWTSGGIYNSVAVDLDTTLTISGKASDSKSVGDAIGKLKNDIEYRVAYLGAAGILTANGTYSIPFPLKENHTYTVTNTGGVSVSINLRNAPRGENIQTISTGLNVGASRTFLCNQDTVYISGWCGSETTISIVEEESKIDQYNKYGDKIQLLANGEYPVTWIVGGFVTADGTIVANKYYTYSDLIDCSSGNGNLRVITSNRLAYCCWYNADESTVQAFVIAKGDNIISAPNGFRYCRISGPTSDIQSTKIYGVNYLWPNNAMLAVNDVNLKIDTIEDGYLLSNDLNSFVWEQGGLKTTGEDYNSNYYIRTKFLFVGNLSALSYIIQTGKYMLWFTYNRNKEIIDIHNTWTGSSVIPIEDNVYYIRLIIAGDQTVITPADAPDIVSVFGQNKFGLSIPGYWIDVLTSKINTIRELQKTCGTRGDEFVYITDYHDSKNGLYNCNNSPDMIERIMNKTSARFVVFGGDGFDHESNISAYREGQYNFYNKFNFLKVGQFYPVIGNHEWYSDLYTGTEADAMTPEEVYNINYKRYESQFENTDFYASYSFDNKVQKIRYYVLGCNYNSVITNNQISWLFEDLVQLPDGYSIFLITHSGVYRDTENPEIPALNAWYQTIINALDALKTGSSIIFDNVTYDFAGRSKTVICALSGHNHVDMSTESAQGIPIVNRAADTLSSALLEHAKGTITEHAFDIVNIDMTNRKIYFTRIGAGDSATFDF